APTAQPHNPPTAPPPPRPNPCPAPVTIATRSVSSTDEGSYFTTSLHHAGTAELDDLRRVKVEPVAEDLLVVGAEPRARRADPGRSGTEARGGRGHRQRAELVVATHQPASLAAVRILDQRGHVVHEDCPDPP